MRRVETQAWWSIPTVWSSEWRQVAKQHCKVRNPEKKRKCQSSTLRRYQPALAASPLFIKCMGSENAKSVCCNSTQHAPIEVRSSTEGDPTSLRAATRLPSPPRVGYVKFSFERHPLVIKPGTLCKEMACTGLGWLTPLARSANIHLVGSRTVETSSRRPDRSRSTYCKDLLIFWGQVFPELNPSRLRINFAIDFTNPFGIKTRSFNRVEHYATCPRTKKVADAGVLFFMHCGDLRSNRKIACASAAGVSEAFKSSKGELDLSNPWNKFQHDHAGKGLSKQTLSKMYKYQKKKNK